MKETVIYPELWYSAEFTIQNNSIICEATRIRELNEDNTVSELEDEVEFSAYLRWDGCLEIRGFSHFCSSKAVKNYFTLIKHIYDKGSEIGFDID